MSMRIRDKARRFITLIDELYNHHCCLCCLASSSIDELFQGTEDGTLFDLERLINSVGGGILVIKVALLTEPPQSRLGFSFQLETETKNAKLRRDVLAEGNVGSGGTPVGITSILSGQEEIFAFHRAVSRLVEMQTPLYLDGVRDVHPYFQRQPRRSQKSSGSLLSEASI
ncbi:hypothetical protein AHAS_Ahas06G0233300 [Arachis hypogaea]